jgi:asparagine synthase (glutamine-hydrolysing)
MCGICGFVDLRRKTSAAVLETMRISLSHRGPDSGREILLNDNTIGFGHQRLSIIDLSDNASQPMWSSNKRWCIAFNGEIYNYKELRNQLLIEGYNFHTKSDTEVLLNAFDFWGIDCLSKLTGMFAFALLDQNEQKLYLVRDRAGIKPLYYYHKNGQLLFGSELKALMANPNFDKKINISSASHFFQSGFIPAPLSVFEHTFKVKPGSYVVYDINKDLLRENSYWSILHFLQKPKLNIDYEEAVNETERLMKNAYNYRMVADVPVGIFLSGGYDSTSVATLLQKDNTSKLNTFTIGFQEEKWNEAPRAKKIAEFLNTNHREYYCTIEDALEILPDLPYYYDEPMADSSAIPTMLVSKFAKQFVTVALSADGGDELFGGYNLYQYSNKLSKILAYMPYGVQKGVSSIFKSIPKKYQPRILSRLTDILPARTLQEVHSLLSKEMTEPIISDLLIDKFNYESLDFNFGKLNGYESLMCFDYNTYLPGDILTKVDRATMSVGLEGREPMLDHSLTEWASQLPINYKISGNSQKRILKDVVHKHVPEKLMNSPKKGFGIPINTWIRNCNSSYIYNFLNEPTIVQQGVLSSDFVNKTVLEYKTTGKNFNIFWRILTWQMWMDKWMS